MGFFDASLMLAALLCSLVSGFLFSFSVVAMPGIGKLKDGEFIRAFQAMDRVIQNNQPIFMVVWVGSVLTLIAAVVFGFGRLDGGDRLLLVGATLLYVLGVQLPTAAINVPLNNALQTLDSETMNESDLKSARNAFEPKWNRWNKFRTILSSVVATMLIALLFGL